MPDSTYKPNEIEQSETTQPMMSRTSTPDIFGKLDDKLDELRMPGDVVLELERRWRAAGYASMSAFRRDLYYVFCYGLEHVETLRNARARNAMGNVGSMSGKGGGA